MSMSCGYKVIARFQGGPNAGHSLKFGDDGFVLHTVPSGIFRHDSVNIIGNGVVIDPVILDEEIQDIDNLTFTLVSPLESEYYINFFHRIFL